MWTKTNCSTSYKSFNYDTKKTTNKGKQSTYVRVYHVYIWFHLVRFGIILSSLITVQHLVYRSSEQLAKLLLFGKPVGTRKFEGDCICWLIHKDIVPMNLSAIFHTFCVIGMFLAMYSISPRPTKWHANQPDTGWARTYKSTYSFRCGDVIIWSGVGTNWGVGVLVDVVSSIYIFV